MKKIWMNNPGVYYLIVRAREVLGQEVKHSLEYRDYLIFLEAFPFAVRNKYTILKARMKRLRDLIEELNNFVEDINELKLAKKGFLAYSVYFLLRYRRTKAIMRIPLRGKVFETNYEHKVKHLRRKVMRKEIVNSKDVLGFWRRNRRYAKLIILCREVTEEAMELASKLGVRIEKDS